MPIILLLLILLLPACGKDGGDSRNPGTVTEVLQVQDGAGNVTAPPTGNGNADKQSGENADTADGRDAVTLQAADPTDSATSYRNQQLQTIARGFDFTVRGVTDARHDILGDMPPLALLSSDEKLIYRQMGDARFWNSVDLGKFSLEPLLEGPFRDLLAGELIPLDGGLYSFRLQLIPFTARDNSTPDGYFIEAVLYFKEGVPEIESLRYLE